MLISNICLLQRNGYKRIIYFQLLYLLILNVTPRDNIDDAVTMTTMEISKNTMFVLDLKKKTCHDFTNSKTKNFGLFPFYIVGNEKLCY